MKSNKRFFVSEADFHYLDDSPCGTARCCKRFATREEAEIHCDKMNRNGNKEAIGKLYKEWGKDPHEFTIYHIFTVKETRA